MLERCKSAQEVEDLSLRGKALLKIIEDFPKPVVVAIHGQCLGGGLEVALACHYRIAVGSKNTMLGLPEVMLGLLPGLGGTQRLPRTLMLQDALDMMLTGRKISAKKAKILGLIDQLIDPLDSEQNNVLHLEKEAINVARALADGSLIPNRTRPWTQRLIQYALSYQIVRNMVFSRAQDRIMKLSNGLYPAPLKILDVVQKGFDDGIDIGYKEESTAFGELFMTRESKALFTLFHGQTELKKNRFGLPSNEVKTVGIIGTGLMASGIAQVSLESYFDVILKGRNSSSLEGAHDKIMQSFDDSIKRMKISHDEMKRFMSKLKSCTTYEELKSCDVIIEAIIEDFEVKKKAIQEIEKAVPNHCIIASNTSSLRLSDFAAISQRPDKIIGMHYFTPVEKMQLLEIVTTEWTSQDTIAIALSLGVKQGKTVIVVKDSPGFYTSRVLGTVIEEAMTMLLEYQDFSRVNRISKKLGFPVGILTIIDEIGLDVCVRVGNYMGSCLGERYPTNGLILANELIQDGFLGRKSGLGIFDYANGKTGDPHVNPSCNMYLENHKVEPKVYFTDEDLQLRLLLRFVSEAVLCLQEGILLSPMDGDIGAVFGVGFPPFLGGPFRWLDWHGADEVVAKMREFEAIYGSKFTPCELLLEHANDPTKKFYST